MMTAADNFTPDVLRQIRWRCGHGGMLELDLIFTHFFDAHFLTLTKALQQDFVALLNCSDAHLFAWLMGVEAPEPQYRAILERIHQSNVVTDFSPL